MTAHERYQKLVGEIGIPRLEYLYELRFVDIYLIQRGYDARSRNLWSATRWQTYYIMSSFIGSDGMRKSGLTGPKDLLEFPWEKETEPPLSDEEVDEIRKELENLNK